MINKIKRIEKAIKERNGMVIKPSHLIQTLEQGTPDLQGEALSGIIPR